MKFNERQAAELRKLVHPIHRMKIFCPTPFTVQKRIFRPEIRLPGRGIKEFSHDDPAQSKKFAVLSLIVAVRVKASPPCSPSQGSPTRYSKLKSTVPSSSLEVVFNLQAATKLSRLRQISWLYFLFVQPKFTKIPSLLDIGEHVRMRPARRKS